MNKGLIEIMWLESERVESGVQAYEEFFLGFIFEASFFFFFFRNNVSSST